MASILNSDVSDLMVKGMLSDIREEVEKQVIEKLVEDFREKATALVREHTQGIVLSHVEQVMNVARMREELYVRIDMGEEGEFHRVPNGG